MEEQYRKGAAAARRIRLPFFLQRLHDDGGRGKGQRHAYCQTHLPAQARRYANARECQRRQRHLPAAQSEDRPAHAPQQRRLQLQSDQEKHDHDPELGEVQDVFSLGPYEAQTKRPDCNARHEKTQDCAQSEFLENRNADNRSEQVNENAYEK